MMIMVPIAPIHATGSSGSVRAIQYAEAAELMIHSVDLGDLVVLSALFFAFLIVIFECLERRREGERERELLDAIDREYQAYRRLGRL